MAFQALYARQFHEQMMELPDAVYERVEHSVDLLIENPGLLRIYDPPYEASAPPVDCMWYYIPGTHKVAYLTIDENKGQMRFLFLGDTREDPLHRFDRMYSGE
jgi:hypothetical protein